MSVIMRQKNRTTT